VTEKYIYIRLMAVWLSMVAMTMIFYLVI
jgi:hypothetical protein